MRERGGGVGMMRLSACDKQWDVGEGSTSRHHSIFSLSLSPPLWNATLQLPESANTDHLIIHLVLLR